MEIRSLVVSNLRKERGRQERDLELCLALVKLGRRGSYTFHPTNHTAIAELARYIDSLESYDQAKVIVLPYVTLPEDLSKELKCIESYGGEVKRIAAGTDEWPAANSFSDPRQFQNALFRRLWAEIFPPGVLPSAHLRHMEATTPGIVIARKALETCDQVPDFRLAFIQECGRALRDYVLADGCVGPLDAFFSGRGLDYAKTGGSKCSLSVYRDGICIYTGDGYDHLKAGDHTSPQSAVRLYFHLFQVGGVQYAAILYAGIHPAGDINSTIYL